MQSLKAREARWVRFPRPSTAKYHHSHHELCNPDGPSQLETGNVVAMDLRTAIGLRAAIDDAVYKIAQRFGLKYQVLRAQFGADGAVYRIGLEVRGRRAAAVYATGNAPIVSSTTATEGKPLGSARLPKTSAK